MNSGIYKLTFPSGHYYIGKTIDFDRRWKEHLTKMENGTAAKIVQECYNTYGPPRADVLHEVHPDHIDVIEPLIIDQHWSDLILNTTRDRCARDIRSEYWELIKESLGSLCHRIMTQDRKINSLQRKITDIKSGTELEKLEKKLEEKTEELRRLKNKGFFDRLFNR
jgi:hypothetical protein